MKELYLAILEKLKQDFPDWHIDLWNAQTEHQKQISCPAIFIEMQIPTYHAHGNGKQRGDVELVIRLVQELYEDTSNSVDTAEQSRALELLDNLNKLYVCLQNFEGNEFTKLDRVSTKHDVDYTHRVIHEVEFSTTLYDSSKLDSLQKIKPEMKIIPDLTFIK